MDNQAFELRRAGLLQMRGKDEFIDMYDQEFDDLMAEVKQDPDEDRRQAHVERLKTDGKHQIAYLLTLAYKMVVAGEDQDEEKVQ